MWLGDCDHVAQKSHFWTARLRSHAIARYPLELGATHAEPFGDNVSTKIKNRHCGQKCVCVTRRNYFYHKIHVDGNAIIFVKISTLFFGWWELAHHFEFLICLLATFSPCLRVPSWIQFERKKILFIREFLLQKKI